MDKINEYKHNCDVLCNITDFIGPLSMVMYFIFLVFVNVSLIVDLFSHIQSHAAFLDILFIIFILIVFILFFVLFFKQKGGIYPFKLLLEHILYFSISRDVLHIKYTENGINRSSIVIPIQNISNFCVNYSNIREQVYITCITASIEINTIDGNYIKIKSTGGIFGLVKFLCKNSNKIPNYSCHTDNESMKKYLIKLSK